MTDEVKLRQAETKARNAQNLIDSPLLTEAFTTLEAAYIQAWRTTNADDERAREKLFLAVNVIGKVRDHLTKAIADGQLATAELKQLIDVTERQKAWHEIR